MISLDELLLKSFIFRPVPAWQQGNQYRFQLSLQRTQAGWAVNWKVLSVILDWDIICLFALYLGFTNLALNDFQHCLKLISFLFQPSIALEVQANDTLLYIINLRSLRCS